MDSAVLWPMVISSNLSATGIAEEGPLPVIIGPSMQICSVVTCAPKVANWSSQRPFSP